MRLRYSLRLMLVGTFVAAVILSVFVKYHRVRTRSRDAKRQLMVVCKRLGGYLELDLVDGDLSIILEDAKISESDASSIANLYRATITEDVWWWPQRCPIHVVLRGCRVSRFGLVALLTDQVCGLHLDRMQTDTTTLTEAFHKVPELEFLGLDNMVIGDSISEEISRLPLQTLSLTGTDMSVAAVASILEASPQLIECRTSLSERQLDPLKERFVHCSFPTTQSAR